MLPNPATLFQRAVDANASDIHLAAGAPVLLRIDGVLTPQEGGELNEGDLQKFIAQVMGEERMKEFEKSREIDVAYALTAGVRLRVNCHYECGAPGLVARIIPGRIPTVQELGLESVWEMIGGLQEGLVLFTGPTGAGKSTSLASLISTLLATRPSSLVTLEDPIEFLFPRTSGAIRQRQYGDDFLSFPEALKRVLRQDPDIVMVGEMRDPETIAAALTLAETGHLIFATLHTPNTVQTIDRIIDVFAPHQQAQVRSQLSLSLRTVISQKLLPKVGGGRVALREIMVNTPAVANTIRDARLQELNSVLQTGGESGMVPFEKDAKRLYKEGLITKETFEWIGE